MKESEAKTKSCPINLLIMTSVQIASIGDDKLIDNAKSIAFCVGSDCMMWSVNDCGLKLRSSNE